MHTQIRLSTPSIFFSLGNFMHDGASRRLVHHPFPYTAPSTHNPQPATRTLLNRIHTPLLHRLLSSINIHTNPQLLPQQLAQTRPIPQINPIPHTTTFLLMHALALQRPVETLRARDGGGKPYLLVGRLLVQDVGAVGRVGEGEYAGLLRCWSVLVCCSGG